ncbi:MAG: cell division protein FtsA [Firmicutes bacterium]|nr:cell division protein FtsA [Bacillota bacterium]
MKKGIYLYCGIRKQRWRVLGSVHLGEEHIIAAVDLGTSKVAALIAVLDDQGACRVMGVGTGSHSGLRRGIIEEQASVAQAMMEAVIKAERMAMVPLPKPMVGIPGVHASSFVGKGLVTITRSNRRVQTEDIERVIEAAKTAVVPLGRRVVYYVVQGFTIDDTPVNREPVGLVARRLGADVQFMTMALPALESYRACMDRAGIEAKQVMMQGVAATRSTLSSSQLAEGVILVDIGAGLTDFALYRDSKLWHMGSLPVGTENFVQDLVVGLGMRRDEAEHLVKALGGNSAPSHIAAEPLSWDNPEVLADYDRIFEARAEEIWQLIDARVAHVSGGRSWPSGVKLVGGGALVRGFAELGTSIMGLPVEVVQPAGVDGLPEAWQNPSSAVCVGLILHQADDLAKSAGHGKRLSMMDGSWQRLRTWLGL